MESGQGIDTVVFDFDGTLFHLDIDWDRLRQKLGLMPGGPSLGEVMQQYRAERHPDLQHVTDAELAAVRGKQLDAQTTSTLDSLARKYHVAVLTRNSRLAVEKVIKGTALEGNLYIVGREDTENLKPHPEGLELILDHFKTRGESAVLVGDTSHDIETAHRAGAKSVIVHNPRLLYTPKGADSYIDSLSELETITDK